MTYMVMECHLAYAVLVDEEGRFVKAANRHYEVGQRVTAPVLMEKPRETFTVTVKWIRRTVLALAACLLIVLGVARFAATPSPYMSVTMTINPTVRIDLNRDGEVTDVIGLNADGKALVKSYDADNMSIEVVTGALIERAISMGYLHDSGTVRFAVRCDDVQKKATYEQKLSEHTTAIIGERMDVTVEVADERSEETTTVTKNTRPVTRDDDDDDEDDENDDDDNDDDEDDENDDDDDDDDENDDDENDDDGR